MEFPRADRLLTKYWKGETTLAEDEELRNMLHNKETSKLEAGEGAYFTAIDKYAHADLPDSFDEELLRLMQLEGEQYRILSFWKVAAIIILMLTGGYTLWQIPSADRVAVAEMEDARKAFEMTKQALFMFSSELNRGASFAMELENFDATIDKIKSKDRSNKGQ